MAYSADGRRWPHRISYLLIEKLGYCTNVRARVANCFCEKTESDIWQKENNSFFFYTLICHSQGVVYYMVYFSMGNITIRFWFGGLYLFMCCTCLLRCHRHIWRLPCTCAYGRRQIPWLWSPDRKTSKQQQQHTQHILQQVVLGQTLSFACNRLSDHLHKL